jgi:2-dehydropantoate 2-reductase
MPKTPGAASEDVIIMDGSMGRQLCLNGMPQDDLFRKIWSARALVDESLHSMVVDAHRSYIEAGATILITNSYGVQPTYYRRAFPDDWKEQMLAHVELATRLAVQARTECSAQNVRIFGCLPPLCESHRPDLFKAFFVEEGAEAIEGMYRSIAQACLRGGADALIVENSVCLEEAEVALKAIKDLGVSVILSMEGALRTMDLQPSPQKAPEVAEFALEAKRNGHQIEALGFSCTEPETILECFKAIQAKSGLRAELQKAGIRLSAHGNCNDRKEAHAKGFNVKADKSQEIKKRKDLCEDGYSGYAHFCKQMVDNGASIVGGCCGCGPEGIQALSTMFCASYKKRCMQKDAEVANIMPGHAKIAVLGCGAMGSVYAGLLASGGNEVWAVDVWKEHIDAIREKGLQVSGASGDRTVKINATMDPAEIGSCDLAIIATKASGVADAAKTAAKLIRKGGVILTIQNGLGSGERIAQYINSENVMLGIASNFGASMKSPGHAEHKSMNLICIGEMNCGDTERLKKVVSVWAEAGFKAEGSADIQCKIWEKLVCNCTYGASCTLTGLTVGEVQDDPAAMNTALSCAREADTVARALGIKLSYDDVEEYVRKFGATVRGARPSMAQDHLAKRRSEVDAINGAVVDFAEKNGLAAPVNKTVSDLIRARENHFSSA